MADNETLDVIKNTPVVAPVGAAPVTGGAEIVVNQEMVDRALLKELKKQLRDAVNDLPNNSPARAALLAEIDGATSVESLLAVAMDVDRGIDEAKIAENINRAEIAFSQQERDLINKQWEIDTVAGRLNVAHILLGEGQDPETYTAMADMEENDPDVKNALAAEQHKTAAQRRQDLGTRDSRHKAADATIDEINGDIQLYPEGTAGTLKEIKKCGFGSHADVEAALENLKAHPDKQHLDALNAAVKPYHDKWVNRDLLMKKNHPTMSDEQRDKVNYSADQVAALLDKDITERSHSAEKMGAGSKRKMVETLAGVKTLKDPVQRAANIRNLIASELPPGTSEAVINAGIQKYTAAHPPESVAFRMDVLIRDAMNKGADAMMRGNVEASYVYAKAVSDAMAVPGSGYSPEQAKAAFDLLTMGADDAKLASSNQMFADLLGGHGLGRDELILVMSDPVKRKQLIEQTILDIKNSTPGHLKTDAQFMAKTFAVHEVAINASLNLNIRASLDFDKKNVHANQLGITLSGNDDADIRAIREALNKVGINLESFDTDHNGLSTSELNNAITRAAASTKGQALGA